MSTIVFLHAHPDDEASQTSGSMARAVREGHRVVVVYATNGDFGTAADDLGGLSVAEYRRREAQASADAIGTTKVEWLGYSDSGMTGWPQNDAEGAFMRADVDEAARRVAAILDAEGAGFLVGYDWHGNYGHPDHVMVHKVGQRAAELVTGVHYLEETMSREAGRRMFATAQELGVAQGWDPDASGDDGNPTGMPEAEITWRVDVRHLLDVKRAALAAHASQAEDAGMMLAMPPQMFEAMFGYEYYIDPALGGPMRDGWPFGEAA